MDPIVDGRPPEESTDEDASSSLDFEALERELHLGAAREAVHCAGNDEERATALVSLGAAAAFADFGEEARAAAAEALSAAQRVGDPELLLKVRAGRLSVHQWLGDHDAVLHELAELAVHSEGLGRWDLVTVWMGALSDAAGASGDVNEALRYLGRAKLAAERSGDPLLVAKVSVALAEWTDIAGRLHEARILTEAAIDALTAVGDADELAHQWCRLGMLSFRLEDFASARDQLLRAQDEFIAVDLTSAAAQLDRNIGAAALHLGRIDEARRRLMGALQVARDDFDRSEEGRVALDLGELSRLTSDYPAARHWYSAAATIAEELDDDGMAIAACSGLASATSGQGQWREAVVQAESALTRSQAREEYLGVVNCLIQLGQLHRILGDAGRAEQRLQEALEGASVTNYALGEANASIGLGFLYHQLGRLAEAQAYFRRAMTFAFELRDRVGAANASLGLTLVATTSGRYSEAAMEATTGLEMAREIGYRRMEQQLLRQLAAVALEQGDVDAARTRLDTARAVAADLDDPTGMADNDSLGGALRMRSGDTEGAEALLRAALAGHRRLEDRIGATVDLRRLGELRLAQGDRTEGITLLRSAVAEAQALGAAEELARALGALAAALDSETPEAQDAAARSVRLFEALAAMLPTGWDRGPFDERHGEIRERLRATSPAAVSS